MPSSCKEHSAGIYVVCTQKESPLFPITARMKGRDIKERILQYRRGMLQTAGHLVCG